MGKNNNNHGGSSSSSSTNAKPKPKGGKVTVIDPTRPMTDEEFQQRREAARRARDEEQATAEMEEYQRVVLRQIPGSSQQDQAFMVLTNGSNKPAPVAVREYSVAENNNKGGLVSGGEGDQSSPRGGSTQLQQQSRPPLSQSSASGTIMMTATQLSSFESSQSQQLQQHEQSQLQQQTAQLMDQPKRETKTLVVHSEVEKQFDEMKFTSVSSTTKINSSFEDGDDDDGDGDGDVVASDNRGTGANTLAASHHDTLVRMFHERSVKANNSERDEVLNHSVVGSQQREAAPWDIIPMRAVDEKDQSASARNVFLRPSDLETPLSALWLGEGSTVSVVRGAGHRSLISRTNEFLDDEYQPNEEH